MKNLGTIAAVAFLGYLALSKKDTVVVVTPGGTLTPKGQPANTNPAGPINPKNVDPNKNLTLNSLPQ